MANNFCTNCGSPLNPGAKFCGKCGTPTVQSPTPENTSRHVQGTSGQVLQYRFLTPASYKKNLVVMKGVTLIFTNTRIIVAFVDKDLMNRHIENIRKEHEGEKFFKRAAATMKAGSTFIERYFSMTESEILSEAPQNFYIPNNNVVKIRFKKSQTRYDSDNSTRQYPAELKIVCPGEKYTFSFGGGLDSRAFINILRELFPGAYKGPKR